MNKFTCVLMTTTDERLSKPAEDFAKGCFNLRLVSRHSWNNAKINDEILAALGSREVDYLFSFLCPVLFPQHILEMTRRGNINIHPGPPEYPGIASASRALYDQRLEYGVTAHIMEKKVDSGRILKVVRFPVFREDTCETLHFRAQMYSLGYY